MAIKTLRVKNFKSFKDVEVHLGDFNVLIGANASGKSNFIQVIKFLRDIQRHGLDNAIQMQGGPEYITNLSIGTEEGLSVELVLSDSDGVIGAIGGSKGGERLLFPEGGDLTYAFSIRFRKKGWGFDVLEDRLAFRGKFSTWPVRHAREKGEEPQQYGVGEVVVARDGEDVSVKTELPGGLSPDEYEIMPYLPRRTVPTRSLILGHLSSGTGQFSDSVGIYDFDPKLPKEATPVTGKAELEESGSNLAIVLKKITEDKDSRRRLANLLQDMLPFVSGLHVEKSPDRSLLFSLREVFAKSKHLPASFISDGTINVTALIVALYFEKKPVAVIEEPERNIHPHLISRIVQMIKDASRHKQIIVTTHNPEVVRSADVGDVLLVSRDAEGFSTLTRPAEQEDVKVFLKNEMGLDELFAQNLLHA